MHKKINKKTLRRNAVLRTLIMQRICCGKTNKKHISTLQKITFYEALYLKEFYSLPTDLHAFTDSLCGAALLAAMTNKKIFYTNFSAEPCFGIINRKLYTVLLCRLCYLSAEKSSEIYFRFHTNGVTIFTDLYCDDFVIRNAIKKLGGLKITHKKTGIFIPVLKCNNFVFERHSELEFLENPYGTFRLFFNSIHFG